MHKLAKGLKKKKKGKKSKHKEEELFKPEELEAYRKQHAAEPEEAPVKNEEWRNFLSLTSGVDDILKKTQDDLDRIKSTSFFQRIPPPSETEAKKAEEEAQCQAAQQEEAASVPLEEPQIGIVQVSESESDEEEEDDIFDTAYIDAIATGEVKLAYIPDSPTEKQEEDDPFDTSIAERAILGPAVERKGKKLVPLGAAVEVLTGRVQLPTCATKPPSTRRHILKETDLLLGSFDNNTGPPVNGTEQRDSPQVVKTLLDDDEIPLPDAPIDLSKTLYIPPSQPAETIKVSAQSNRRILEEFEEDENDKEFEALAAESLSKPAVAVSIFPENTTVTVQDTNWKPFEKDNATEDDFEVDTTDPFDTTFADNILPGKAELKLIEREILENDVDFDPRAQLLSDRVPESQLSLIAPVHRDLLGGSTSDLSHLEETPILPIEQDFNEIKYCDPFNTSIADSIKTPGKAELKHIERELLSDIKCSKTLKSVSVDDDDFNPRALETAKPRTLSRPDVLNVGHSKSVSFSVPNNQSDLLLATEDTTKASKPLTPFYVRKNSVPGEIKSPDSAEEDPFDTSFVPSLTPGKTELKIIESELFEATIPLKDSDFDPRDEDKVAKVAAVEAIKEIAKPKPSISNREIDLLSAFNDSEAKVLTPSEEILPEESVLSYADPFDTSIAANIPPGKAELKLLENELIEHKLENLETHQDLLVHGGDTIIEKPLSPQPERRNIEAEPEDFDPFDTSFACNIQPGKAELKVLESELI